MSVIFGPTLNFLNTRIFLLIGDLYFTECIMIWSFSSLMGSNIDLYVGLRVDCDEKCKFAVQCQKIHIFRPNWPSDPFADQYQIWKETENDWILSHSVKCIPFIGENRRDERSWPGRG